MKKVSCADINPDTTCDYEVEGNSTKDVVGKMMTHIKAEHPDDITGMNDSEIRTMIEDKIHS